MVVNREQTVERIMQAISLMQQIGVPPPDLIQPVYTLIGALGFRPDQFGLPPSADEYIAYMQQVNAQGGGPGGAPGSSPMGGAPQALPGPSGPPSAGNLAKQVQAQGAPMPG